MITNTTLRQLETELITARLTSDDLTTRITADDAVAYTDLTGTPSQIQQVYYQATAPSHSAAACVASTVSSGDYWIDSDDNMMHLSDGSTWGEIQDVDIADGVDAKALTDVGFDENGNLITSVLPASNVTPDGSGLYLGADYLGYFASGEWTSYMDASGNFYLGGSTGQLQWDGAVLAIEGSIDITGTSTVQTLLQLDPGGVLRSDSSANYPYLEFSNEGLQLKDSDDGGTVGTAVVNTDKVGFGATVWIMNSTYNIPWMETKEPVDGSANDMPSIRLFDRSADPSGGTYTNGDLSVVNGLLMIYVTNAWVVVGDQTAP
jgi:hypothetical protein